MTAKEWVGDYDTWFERLIRYSESGRDLVNYMGDTEALLTFVLEIVSEKRKIDEEARRLMDRHDDLLRDGEVEPDWHEHNMGVLSNTRQKGH